MIPDFDLPDLDLPDFFLPHDLRMEEIIRRLDREAYARRLALELKEKDAEAKRTGVAPIIYKPYKGVDFEMLEPIDKWIEANCYNPDTVNKHTLNLNDPKMMPRKIVLEDYQRRILRHIFTPYKDRISKYTTIIWSQPKKSGKTQISACVGAYFAENVDPPNNVIVVANKKDQAEDRAYTAMKPTIKGLGGNVPTSVSSKPIMRLPNGTEIKALPNSPATEAGDTYCLTLWTEIWAFKTEQDERLFAELMPVETQRVSMRWIDTYAGYKDESTTLLRLFLKAFKDTDERELADGARYVPELDDIITDQRPACIEVPSEELFIFWDHERRMEWQTPEKYEVGINAHTKTEGVRLYQNRWQSSSSELLEEAWIQASVRDNWLNEFAGRQFTLAVDASMRHDSIALVGTFKEGETYYTPFIEIYDPKGMDANLHDLVENRVKALYDEGMLLTYFDEKEERNVTPVYFDPFQLHQIRLNCIEYGIDVIEFNQGEMRKKSDTMLYHLYKDELIVNPKGREDFLEHVRGGKAKYMEGEQLRIIKGTTQSAKRIDALIAQSMSAYGTFLADDYLLKQPDSSSILVMGSTKTGWFGE